MTPTPPVLEIEELTQRLIDEGCEGDGQHCTADDALIPFDQWCLNCLAGRALAALLSETQARQEAERDAIGSRDELNILKVKHEAERLARQQAERARASFEVQAQFYAESLDAARAQLTLSEQARARAEQAREAQQAQTLNLFDARQDALASLTSMRTALETALLQPPSDHHEHLHERCERECWKQHHENFGVCAHPACVLLKRVAQAIGWRVETNGVSPSSLSAISGPETTDETP